MNDVPAETTTPMAVTPRRRSMARELMAPPAAASIAVAVIVAMDISSTMRCALERSGHAVG
jgi:hypothetical protein